MERLLKQSTATTLLLGPFVDETDGQTAETGLTISQADVLLWKEGGTTLAQKTESTSCTHRSNGLYTCPIDTTDTNTLGILTVSVDESGALPIRMDYFVVAATVYDSLKGNTGTGLRADAVAISSDTTAADNLELAFNDTAGAVPWLGVIDQGTAQSATGTTLVLRAAAAFADDTLIGATLMAYGSTQGYWQTRTITDSVLSSDTVTVDTWTVTPSGTITYKILAGPPASTSAPAAVNVTQWGGAAIATPSVAGVPEVDLTHVAGATTNVAALATNVDAILTDTAVIGATGAGLTSLATQASVNTIDDFLDTEIAAIKAKTDNLPSDPADQSAVEAAILAAWTTALTESYAANGAAFTPAQGLYAIHQMLMDFAISGTTISVKRLGGTEAFAVTLDDATTPTSASRD